MKRTFVRLVESIIPIRFHLFVRFFIQKLIGDLDQEMFYVIKLLHKKRRFLDIGSNAGIYSYYFSTKFSKIDAFEPLKEVTYRLEALGGKNTRIHNVALSDKRGTLPIHIPVVNGHQIATRASLEAMNCDCEVRIVDVVPLDQYEFIDVDLVKIDVEGHENAVLDGAINTITLCKPIIIIEIEQRHINKDICTLFEKIFNFGYDGFFLNDWKINPLSEFSYEKNQEPFLNDFKNRDYINNFIFTPRKRPNT